MTANETTLFGTAATVEAVQRARAILILVGGYDGSGNYGDVVQFDATVELAGRLGPSILALPVLERQYLSGHELLSEGSDLPALFFDPGDEGRHDDVLLPVAAPVDLAFGGSYLYGGGYLNRLWGPRKLAMLDEAEALLDAGGAKPSCRLSSGLQVEPDWVGELAANDRMSAVGSLEFLGGRDSSSQRALAALDIGVPAVNTGDDAVGLLGRLPAGDTPANGDGTIQLNLHFAEHDWVTERPQAMIDFYSGFVTELARLGNRPVVAQPVVAYLDGRIDERSAAKRLAEACAAAGIEAVEPLVLRSRGLSDAAPRLRRGTLTLSCSYHVALTSLMLEVPALLLGDNPYYEQKAAGLREDFALPPTFVASAAANPVATAGEIAALLLADGPDEENRERLTAAVERVRRRRAAVEVELLGRLGRAAMTALDERVRALDERLRSRSAEPAELQMRLATLQSEAEELRSQVEESPLEAELRVQDAESRAEAAEATLATLLGSRSWRMAAPLRRLGALGRRR